MSTTLTINGAVTLDESYSLQSSGTASGAEDNNDNDVSLSLMATEASSFYSRLFTGLSLSATFPTSNGVAKSASNFISTSGSGTVSNLGFVATAGAALPVYGSSSSGAASNLTAVDGGAISLFSDSVLGNKMVLGVDSKNQIVFAIFMQPNETFTSAAVWMVQFEAISHLITTNPDDAMSLTGLGVAADATMAFNFNALPSGQNLFGMVGNSATGLVVIGKTPALNSDGTFTNASNTINTSQGGGPTTIGVNNQMFDAGEGAYFTFVNNPVANYLAGAVNGLDQNEADDADNIQFGSRLEVNGASVTLSQVQGNEAVSLKITAFNGNNSLSGKAFATTGPSGGLGTGGPPITITQIIISDATGPIRTIDNPTAVNGAVTISNLQAGYTIAWKTSGLHDQVLIEGVTGKFDIGGFGVNQPSSSVTPLTGIRFEDDGPDVTLSLKSGQEVRVDESRGQNAGENEDASLGRVTVAGSVLFNTSAAFGQDGEGSSGYSLVLTLAQGASSADSGLKDTASNESVMLSKDGNDIVGRISGGVEVLRISIDTASGDITLTQYRAMKHGNPADHDEANSPLTIAAGLVYAQRAITDGDGDGDQEAADIGPAIKFEDDGPAIGPVANSVVDFIKNASVTKTLNGSVGSDAKVSPYVLYDDPNNPNDFTTSLTINGINLKAVFSAGNTVATYYADSNGDGVFGNGLDEAYYQLSLGQTGAGAYTFQVLKDPPPATVNFNFNDLPSGQNLFGMLGTSAAGLVVIGKKPVVSSDGTFTNTSNTINTSQGGGGTTIGVNNQMFDGASNANNQEGAYFTFVKNPNPNFLGSSLDANEADDADNMQFGSRLEVDNGFLRIVQVQGNTGVSLSLTAYNGTQPLYTPTGTNKFAGLGDGLTANFTSVVVVSGGIERVVPITGTGPVTVGGLKAGDIIKWKTDGLHDQVLVQALTGKFDIGGFGTTSGAPTPDQKLDFTVRVTDGDDDWSSASFSVGVDGTGIFDDNAVSGVSVTQTTNLMSTGEDSSLLLLGSTLMMESHHLNIT